MKVKLLLNGSHLAPQGESRNVIMGMTTWSSQNTAPRETPNPYLARQISKQFYDTSTGAAIGAAHCGSFVGEGFGLLVIGYGRMWTQRFTWFGPPERVPYVHRRIVLYCLSLSCLCEHEPSFFLL
jgi:hypothetical protein